jgi:hypothetical protein
LNRGLIGIMKKTYAIDLLGGSITAAAKTIGISYQAVGKWPDELPPRIADRVYAVWGKKNMPSTPEQPQSTTPTPLNIDSSDQERRAMDSRCEAGRRVTDAVVGGV